LDQLLEMLKRNKGKAIGITLGLIFGILVLSIGLFRTILLALCVFVGYYFGSKSDKRENFMDFLDKILPTGLK
jgi:uncharacterized membrane protein